ncbi:unnamed protein product [Bursaphelenchus xylophilus]|uniref:(pine wood nematode) hypothetical protein n=1 Tax=Bursaphelenchus xylophilus TaxID=6326 RepID=A0A1I7S492_BURXY|nr:unnamed protein product [Bursaphelenchus xylophilus]CAG9116852.1 unnamed protein product [Bursaphelenchus xylophilus]
MSVCRRLGQTLVFIRNRTDIVYNDVLRLSLKAGSGGNGLARYNGIGGAGGNIYVMPERNLDFAKVYEKYRHKGWVIKAESGKNAQKVKLVGEPGEHTIIKVPVGVECVDIDTKLLLARCVVPGVKCLMAKGGRGGSVANNFKGEQGQHIRLAIHLKLNTNIGLVGLPNAGKSTLLKAFVPKSSVKIANYPFTTIKPQVLDVEYETDASEDKFSLSVADLPGIIEGASRNRGRGYAFLKHLEYSEIIVMVVDLNGFQLSAHFEEPYRDVYQSIAILCKEMEAYDPKLIRKPLVIALNKKDMVGEEKTQEVLGKLSNRGWWKEIPEALRPIAQVKFRKIFAISAKHRQVDELKDYLRGIHENLNAPSPMSFKSHEQDGGEVMI